MALKEFQCHASLQVALCETLVSNNCDDIPSLHEKERLFRLETIISEQEQRC